MVITKDEWVNWRREAVTQQVIRDLLENRESRKEEIAQGSVEGNELYREIGRTQGVLDAVEYMVKFFKYAEIESGPESSSL